MAGPHDPSPLPERRRVAVLWILTAASVLLAATVTVSSVRSMLVESLASKQHQSLRQNLLLFAEIDITAEPYYAFDPTTATRSAWPVLLAGGAAVFTLNLAGILCLLRWRTAG
jgi:hypothetical protein